MRLRSSLLEEITLSRLVGACERQARLGACGRRLDIARREVELRSVREQRGHVGERGRGGGRGCARCPRLGCRSCLARAGARARTRTRLACCRSGFVLGVLDGDSEDLGAVLLDLLLRDALDSSERLLVLHVSPIHPSITHSAAASSRSSTACRPAGRRPSWRVLRASS